MPLYANFRTLELCFHEQFTIKIYSVPGTRIAVTRAMVSGLATSISGYTNACCSFGVDPDILTSTSTKYSAE